MARPGKKKGSTSNYKQGGRKNNLATVMEREAIDEPLDDEEQGKGWVRDAVEEEKDRDTTEDEDSEDEDDDSIDLNDPKNQTDDAFIRPSYKRKQGMKQAAERDRRNMKTVKEFSNSSTRSDGTSKRNDPRKEMGAGISSQGSHKSAGTANLASANMQTK